MAVSSILIAIARSFLFQITSFISFMKPELSLNLLPSAQLLLPFVISKD